MRARERARYRKYHSLYPDKWIDRSKARITEELIKSLSMTVSLNGRSFKADSYTKRGTVKTLTKLYRG